MKIQVNKYLILAGLTLLLFACVKKSPSSGEETPLQQYTIGVSIASFSDKFMTYVISAIKEYAGEHQDIIFKFTDAGLDSSKQLNSINNFIVDGVDALIMLPNDDQIVLPIAQKAKKSGVPLVLVNKMGTAESMEFIQTYVGSQEIEAGRIQGKEIVNATNGQGKVAILMGTLGHAGQIYRTQGVEEILGSPDYNYEIVDRQTADWGRPEGLAVVQDWLQAYPDLDIIVANNDEMAIGALLAANKSGKKDEDLLIGGVDATPDALEFLGEGLDFTVFQDAEGQGRGAAEAAHKWAKGETAAARIWIPFELVTPENVKTSKTEEVEG